MGIALAPRTVELSGAEQYVLTLILQSAKRQMQDWKQKGRPDIARHYQVVCSLLQKVDPPNPKGGAA